MSFRRDSEEYTKTGGPARIIKTTNALWSMLPEEIREQYPGEPMGLNLGAGDMREYTQAFRDALDMRNGPRGSKPIVTSFSWLPPEEPEEEIVDENVLYDEFIMYVNEVTKHFEGFYRFPGAPKFPGYEKSLEIVRDAYACAPPEVTAKYEHAIALYTAIENEVRTRRPEGALFATGHELIYDWKPRVYTVPVTKPTSAPLDGWYARADAWYDGWEGPDGSKSSTLEEWDALILERAEIDAENVGDVVYRNNVYEELEARNHARTKGAA